MPYKYIGKTTDFRGKSLWEILGNLKNFGIGRIVVRSRFERYPEPSYLKILKVETLPEPINPSMDNIRLISVLVENTFRGKTDVEPVTILKTSYKTDYRLIPKDEEAEYCKLKQPIDTSEKIFPRTTDFPPILKELIIRESVAKGEIIGDPKLEIVYNAKCIAKYRLAKEGETPTVPITNGLGIPFSLKMYKNIKLSS